MTYLPLNIKKYIWLLFICLSACSDWLDEQPIDELVQDNFWHTKEELRSVLMAAYAQFASTDDMLFLYGELRGDMLEMRTPTAAQRLVMEGNLEPDNSLANWAPFYRVINYCNLVIEYGELTRDRDQTFTEYQYRVYLSEALFLRSLAYFYLVRVFKDVPFVIRSSKTDNQDFNIAKSDDSTIIRSIIKDLEKAVLFAPDDHREIRNTKGRATKSSIYALLADIHLWIFDYDRCIHYCDIIIGSNRFLLIPGAQWYTIFYPGNSMEGIFELQQDQGLQQPNKMYDLTWVDRRFRASLYARDILSMTLVGDFVRSRASFRENDHLIWKYAGTSSDGRSVRPGAEQRSCNWIVYRYADILMMKAEALGHLERYDEAVNLVNQIRQRVFLGGLSAPGNREGMEDIILEEKAREFAFEGKRWFDLMRMGRRNNFERRNDLIEKMVSLVPASQRPVIAAKLANPYGWYFPVFTREMESNINLVQNPYYETFSN